jgi:hypothetical protein
MASHDGEIIDWGHYLLFFEQVSQVLGCLFPVTHAEILATELHAHSRALAYVEYGAQGLSMLICPQDRALSFTDDPALIN